MAILCCAYGCKNRGGHKFPRNAELKKKWLKALNRADFKPTVYSRVCSDHFLDSDYAKRTPNNSGAPNQRKILKRGVVPSVFYWPGIDEPYSIKKVKVLPEMQLPSIGPTISLKNVFLNDTLGAGGEKGSKEIKIKEEENEDCGIGTRLGDEMEIGKGIFPDISEQGFTVDKTVEVMIKQEDDICNGVKKCCVWIMETPPPHLKEEDSLLPIGGVEDIEVEMENPVEELKEIYSVSLPHNPQVIALRRSQRIRPVKRPWSPSFQRKSTPLCCAKKISSRLLKKNKNHLRRKSYQNHFLSIEWKSFHNLKEKMRRSEINELYDGLGQQLQLKTPKLSLTKNFILFKAISCIKKLKYEARQLTKELFICRQKHSKLLSQLSELKFTC